MHSRLMRLAIAAKNYLEMVHAMKQSGLRYQDARGRFVSLDRELQTARRRHTALCNLLMRI